MSPLADNGFFNAVKSDYGNFYSSGNIKDVGLTLTLAGMLANSGADDGFREYVQGNLRSDESDHQVDAWTKAGDLAQLQTALPLYLGAALIGGYHGDPQTDSRFATWGARSLRGLMLGAPQQLMLGSMTGGGRPTEGNAKWWAFTDSNGVSGHAFYGALPLITAAQMSQTPFVKYALYAASTLPGLARINDDKHFLSQVILGWSLAYLSADAVRMTDEGAREKDDSKPIIRFDGLSLTIEWKF